MTFAEQVADVCGNLNQYESRLYIKIGKAVRRGSLLIQADIGQHWTPNGPSRPGEAPAVDTGRLKASIIANPTEMAPDSISASVSTNVPYAIALEFGSEKSGARPFMVPSLGRTRADITSDIQSAAREAAQ